MALRINTNVAAFNTHRNLMGQDSALSKSLEKLSSGLRVNRASDDAAGLSISERLRTQTRGLAQAQRNAQDGISLINTAEGAMNEIHDILQRMRELAVQSANGTLTTADRSATNAEFTAIRAEIDNIANYSTFNGKSLINGAGTFTFQVGANQGQTFAVTTADVRATALTINASTVTDVASASTALGSIDAAIAQVSTQRSNLGAASNRLEHVINNTGVSRENLLAAESRIRDVDMASEMTEMTRRQILLQSGTAMLSQANMTGQAILGLLG